MDRTALWRAWRIVVPLLIVVSSLSGRTWEQSAHRHPIPVLAVAGDVPDPRASSAALEGTLAYLPIVMRTWPPVPAAPRLAAIVNPNGESAYLVLWSSSFLATYYVLEEATDSSFGDAREVFVGLELLYSVKGKTPGDYFYRVKAVHTTSTASYSSAWSNVVSTRVAVTYAYQDTFSDASSGWPHRVFDLGGHPILSSFYMGDAYYMRILVDAGLSIERMGIVPSPYEHFDDTYDVEVDQVFIQTSDGPPDWAKASLVFRGEMGTEGYLTSVYAVEWNFEGNCAVSAYRGSYMDSFIPAVPVPDPIYQGWMHCPSIDPGFGHNVHALAEVRGDEVTIYLNGGLIGTFSPIHGQPYMGLITGAWQAVPVESRFDNFRVTNR